MSIWITIKKYSLIVLQALCVVIISACICIYTFSSSVKVYSNGEIVKENVSISQLRTNYHESDLHTGNLSSVTYDLIRYCVIRDQLETEGEYNPEKTINIGEYANRNSDSVYKGIDVEYYLKDLISWGQYGRSQNGISHSYMVFDNWSDLEAFFGGNDSNKNIVMKDQSVSEDLEESTEIIVGSENDVKFSVVDNSVPMLDTISNRYYTVDGLKLEDYASDSDEYTTLVSYLEDSAISLYTNYRDYLVYNELFNPDNSNIRYYIDNGKGKVFTNLLNYKILNEDKLADTFKEMGEYIYAKPGSLEYTTNTKVEYDFVSNGFLDYSYEYSDDAFIWVGLDTNYPVEDFFSSNEYGIKRTLTMLPFVILLATISLIGFFALLVYICSRGKLRIAASGYEEKMKFLDSLPIEIQIMSAVACYMMIYISSIFILKDVSVKNADSLSQILIPHSILVFLYSLTSLLYFYGLVRRFYTHNILKGSYTVAIGRWIGRRFSFVAVWSSKIYESSGIAIRTWIEYVIFLLFNTFWACMLFFSEIPVVSFIVLLIFDASTGFLLFNKNWEQKKLIEAIKDMNEGDFESKLNEKKFHGINKELAREVNSIQTAIQTAVERSSRDEKLKADLITNVSHDIKTPLTSIINYVDLIKRENIDNERVNNYVRILDEKSQRLKQLTIDLVEASKITSGNITLEINRINFLELIHQAEGEFEEKYESRQLVLVENLPENPVVIEADARYLWRVIENLLQNVYKYAMESTRVYIDLTVNEKNQTVCLSVKNISSQQLNINADELTERFIRGDLARSTEGSGLGLSIVKSLVKAHKGNFDVYLDGDLFKATVTLPFNQTT